MERATKSGFAREAQAKIHGKYDPDLGHAILDWVAHIAGQSFNTDGDMHNFLAVLKDGTVLCAFANGLQPGSIGRVNPSKMPFKQMENISFFLQFAEKYLPKTELFQTVDLYESQSEKLFGKRGFGPKESDGHKREWTDEQLKAGDTIIGLQMGTNKGANASGINMGKTRHICD